MRVTATLGDVLTVLRGQGTRAVSATRRRTSDVIDFGAQLATTVNDNALIAPFCVGTLHLVPDYFSLFPGDPAPYGGEMRPLCDAKLVNLRDGQQAAPDFHSLHRGARWPATSTGWCSTTRRTSSIRTRRPSARSTRRRSCASPSATGRAARSRAPTPISTACTTRSCRAPTPSIRRSRAASRPASCRPASTRRRCRARAERVMADPHFQKQYSHFCYPLQYLPGKTTYLDTPGGADGRLHRQRDLPGRRRVARTGRRSSHR